MKKHLAIIFLCSLFSDLSAAQSNSGKVQGMVYDESMKPLTGANVLLLLKKDSSLIKASVTDKNGKYYFANLPVNNYMLKVSYSGCQSFISETVNITEGSNETLPTFILKQLSKELKAVTVIAEKAFVEQKSDRTIVNIENSIISTGNSALQALEKSPGVTVDDQGRITLFGKQGPLILIDGKPTYLSITDLVNMLRNMPASELDKIELMSNAPAKYDAQGNAGIINLRTKKNLAMGFNGNITAGYTQGRYPKQNDGISFNYRQKKYNLYGNYNYFYNDFYFRFNIIRQLSNNNSPSGLFEQSSFVRPVSNNHSYKAGIDYYINKHQTLGFMVKGSHNSSRASNATTNNILDASNLLDSGVTTNSARKGNWHNPGVNINYKIDFNKPGHEFSADADYISFKQASHQLFSSSYFNKSGTITGEPYRVRAELPGNLNIFSAKADYVSPFEKNARIEAGVKMSYVKNDNNFQFYYYDNGAEKIDLSKSNHFIYRESIYAAYLIFSKEFKKGSIQTGIRGENTDARGKQIVNNVSFKRNYFQLFPSIFLNKELSSKHTVSVSYSRRLNRPSYQDLNPFRSYHDPYTYNEGNPFLGPQFSHNIEFIHTLNKKIISRLYYTVTSEIIFNVFHQDDATGISFLRAENVDKMTEYGYSFNSGLKPAKWWKSNFFLNIYNRIYKGIYSGLPFVNDRIGYNINFSNNFNLGKGYSAELSGFYNSARSGGLFTDASSYMISAGIQKAFKSNFTLKLNVNDLSKGMRGGSVMKFGTVDFRSRVYWDSRTVAVGFSYRFGKKTVRGNRQREGGAEDEKGRIKTEH